MADMHTPLRAAKVHVLPTHSGDGYGFGGGVVLTIGEFAFPFGEGRDAAAIAREIARLWNSSEGSEQP